MNYDVIIIGAGPGGIFSAYELTLLNPSLKVAVFEAGHALNKRRCPIDGNKIKSCIKCDCCSIMSGFGGAGAFSDGKYNITNDFGGTLHQYIGKKQAIELMKYVDDIVTVSDDEVASAILILMERQKLVAEGAGALSVAAAMFGKLPIQDKKTACIVSGGNIDVNILSRVINRGLLTTGRLCHLTIELLDKPGQLRDVSSIIAQYGANVIRVRHNQGGSNTDINDCFLKISLETRNAEHFEQILKALTEKGYKIASSVQ